MLDIGEQYLERELKPLPIGRMISLGRELAASHQARNYLDEAPEWEVHDLFTDDDEPEYVDTEFHEE